MKFGRKPIVLINGGGKPVHNRYNYKFVDKAVYRAMRLPNPFIQIWDNDQGKELGTVTKTRKTITVTFR